MNTENPEKEVDVEDRVDFDVVVVEEEEEEPEEEEER